MVRLNRASQWPSVAAFALAAACLVSGCELDSSGARYVLEFLTRATGWEASPVQATGCWLGLMLVYAATNWVIVGAAMGKGLVTALRQRWKVIGALTLGIHAADRIVTVVAVVTGVAIVALCGVEGEQRVGLGMVVGACLNVVGSGVLMGTAMWKLLKRDELTSKRRAIAAVVAGAVANPAWSLAVLFME